MVANLEKKKKSKRPSYKAVEQPPKQHGRDGTDTGSKTKRLMKPPSVPQRLRGGAGGEPAPELRGGRACRASIRSPSLGGGRVARER